MTTEEIIGIMNNGRDLPIKCEESEAIKILAYYVGEIRYFRDGIATVEDMTLATEDEILKVKDHFYLEEEKFFTPI